MTCSGQKVHPENDDKPSRFSRKYEKRCLCTKILSEEPCGSRGQVLNKSIPSIQNPLPQIGLWTLWQSNRRTEDRIGHRNRTDPTSRDVVSYNILCHALGWAQGIIRVCVICVRVCVRMFSCSNVFWFYE